MVRRFGSATELVLRVQVAMAIRYKGITLVGLKRDSEAGAAYEEVIGRLGDAADPGLRAQVAWALINNGIRLSNRDKDDAGNSRLR